MSEICEEQRERMLNQVKNDNQDIDAMERMCVPVIGLCLCQQISERNVGGAA